MVRSTANPGGGDTRILNRLRRVIEGNGRAAQLDVDVDVENGMVELLGVIPNAREHDALLALVERPVDPRRVIDHLIVRRWNSH